MFRFQSIAAFASATTLIWSLPAQAEETCSERGGQLIELSGGKSGLAIAIAPEFGAKLVSMEIEREGRQLELLYRGGVFCPVTGWDGKAPILWPATGRNFLPDGKTMGWIYKDRQLPLSIHGFARDLGWTVVKVSRGYRRQSATLTLADSARTREGYPFGFRFDITYRVKGRRLAIDHVIRASTNNSGPMPFSIGNHITFRQPLEPRGSEVMRISAAATRHLFLDGAGRPNGEVETIAPLRSVPVTTFGREKAYSLGGFKAAPEVVLDDPGGLAIRVRHNGSASPSGTPVLFNLWGNEALGFFSPEPWLGKQNSLNTGDGLVWLAPGKRFKWTVEVEVDERRTNPR